MLNIWRAGNINSQKRTEQGHVIFKPSAHGLREKEEGEKSKLHKRRAFTSSFYPKQ